MDIDSYLENTLSDLGVVYHEMAAKIQTPVFADVVAIGLGAIKIYPSHWRAS